MNVWDAITSQRAVRRFKGRAIEPEHLDRILEAGRRSPSSKNDQRWGFILVTDSEMLAELSEVGDWSQHLAGATAAIAFVTPDEADPDERESIAFDLGQAVQSMMLTAWELGIGSCHAAVYKPELTRELLGYPTGSRCDYLISLGYLSAPAVLQSDPDRRPMPDLRHDERW